MRHSGFDLEPGEDIDDQNARVRCGKCGYVCAGGAFMRSVPRNSSRNRREFIKRLVFLMALGNSCYLIGRPERKFDWKILFCLIRQNSLFGPLSCQRELPMTAS